MKDLDSTVKNSSIKSLHVVITGRVQGVGFRYATHTMAVNLGLSGWVRNLPGGQVEACFYGEHLVLEQMLDWCKSGPRMANVTDVTFDWQETDTPVYGFQIKG